MSYHFSLQKILDLKEKEKEQLQSALSTSMKQLNEEQVIYTGLMEKKDILEQQLLQSQVESTNISYLIGLHSFQQHLEKNVQQSKQRVTKAEKEVDRKMQQVIDKSKEEKTYGILKSRERTRYMYEQNRTEQNVLDEISINLYMRRTQSSN